MVNAEDIAGVIGKRVERVLLVGRAAMPSDQYDAFKTVVYSELGKVVLREELERLLHSDHV